MYKIKRTLIYYNVDLKLCGYSLRLKLYLFGEDDFAFPTWTAADNAASNATETLDLSEATSSSFSSIKARQRSRCF
jgi:hypothetical protein